MEQLIDLWLPILLSGVAVWFASALFWMVLPHHHKDMGPLPDEDAFIASLKSLGVTPGSYSFPHCADNAARKDPELMRKWKEGPAGFMTIMGKMSMGRNMVLSVLVYLLVSVFVAYLASEAREPGAGFGDVFQVAASAAIMAYLFGWMGGAIWFGMSKNAWIANVIDSVAYGLITGAIFALMWPGAPAVG
jgi:hypothetical protein